MSVLEIFAYSYVGVGAVMAVLWTLLYFIDIKWKDDVLKAIIRIPLMVILAILWLPIIIVVSVAPQKVIRWIKERRSNDTQTS